MPDSMEQAFSGDFDAWLARSIFRDGLRPLLVPITEDARMIQEGSEPPEVDAGFLDFCTGIIGTHGGWQGTRSRNTLREIGDLWRENRLEEAMALFARMEEISGNPWLLKRPWRRYLDSAVHFAEHQQRAIEAGLPAIPLIAFMKTASSFISTAFMLALDIPACQLSLEYVHLIKPWLEAFARGGAITHEHLVPTRQNIALLAEKDLAPIIHLRHPCQIVVSYAHHFFGGFLEGLPESQVSPEGHRLLASDFDAQLDWVIAHVLPLYVAWARGWAAARERVRVHFTTYEAFIEDPEQFLEKLCGVAGLPERAVPRVLEQAAAMDRETGRHNMRNKSSHEWRHILSPDQKAACTRSIPGDFWTLFANAL